MLEEAVGVDEARTEARVGTNASSSPLLLAESSLTRTRGMNFVRSFLLRIFFFQRAVPH